MLKKLNKHTKRTIFLICIGSFFILAFLLVQVLYPFMNLNLVMNIFPFLSPTANSATKFYGENIDMSQILPTSQFYVVNSKGQDLVDIAASLGINFVRITNGHRSFNNNADAIYTRAQWNQVLNKMQRKGIKADILIETASNNENYYTANINFAYLHLVQEYINSGVFSSPDVYSVDIKNEPVITESNIKILQIAHNMIKAKYPNLKQTIGAWATPKSPEDPYTPNNYNWTDFSAGQKLASIVDFYSIHMYGLDKVYLGIGLNPNLKTKQFISQVENGLHTKKPILIEEFGEANGDAVSDQDTIGSSQLQAKVYLGVYQALKEIQSSQLIGSVAFDFYSRNQYPDAWAIVKNHGDYLFPAAYILQEYALGKNNPSLQAATVVNSQSYLVKNADNATIKNVHVSDRIGFKLHLDNGENYYISFSSQGILRTVESFHYEHVSDSYIAVFQATSKGEIQIFIFIKYNCFLYNTCAQIVYNLTVNITDIDKRK